MRFANGILLFVTFIASATLLVMMQRRRLIRRLSLFATLILFYILRSIVLLVGIRLFRQAAYLQISSLMSLLDLGLQLTLAYSLLRQFTRPRVGSSHPANRKLRNSAMLLCVVGLVLAGGVTVLLVSALPGFSPYPLDRGVVFSGLIFLFLLIVPARSDNTAEARLLLGFCVVSAANILSQCGRTLAATQHDAHLFLIWAYGNTVVWVGVLVFWILRLQDSPPRPEVAGAEWSRRRNDQRFS